MNIDDQVWNQVRYQIMYKWKDQVLASFLGQKPNQVYELIYNQVQDQVAAQVYYQVRSPLTNAQTPSNM